jgi:hypothetical protein
MMLEAVAMLEDLIKLENLTKLQGMFYYLDRVCFFWLINQKVEIYLI